MTTADFPQEWRERISEACFWLADNFVIWQPFGLMISVGVLLLASTILVEMWSTR